MSDSFSFKPKKTESAVREIRHVGKMKLRVQKTSFFLSGLNGQKNGGEQDRSSTIQVGWPLWQSGLCGNAENPF